MTTLCEDTLARFQDAFARAVVRAPGSDAEPAVRGLVLQPGFAVYRNTVLKACIDALEANFPAAHRLVGDEWFRAAAAVYARARLPRGPSLLDYGEDFPDFLAGFAPAAELPCLADVAKLDRCWIEAHAARDEAPLDPGCIASLEPAAFARCVLRPHASVRWGLFDGSAVTIWRRNRYDARVDLGDIAYRREGVLLARPYAEVTNIDIDGAQCAFVDACAAGESLECAARYSLAVDHACDLVQVMMPLLRAGTFAAIDEMHSDQKENDR